MTVHYRRLPSINIQERERFWGKVSKEPGQGPKGECWEWQGHRGRNGYGTFYIRPKTHPRKAGQGYTHITNRIAYFLATGIDPFGFHVLHRCDNPPCVNPAHLWRGTPKQNTQDAVAKGRMATGDRSGGRLHPETYQRGAAHWTHRMPERVSRTTGKCKISSDDVRAIRAAAGSQRKIAARFNISPQQVANIKRRTSRSSVE